MITCSRCFHHNSDGVFACELCGSSLASVSSPAASASAPPSADVVVQALSQTASNAAVGAASVGVGDGGLPLWDSDVNAGMKMVLNDEPMLDKSLQSAATLTAMGSGYRLCPRCAAANELTAPSCLQCGASLEHRRAPTATRKVETGMVLVAINEDGSDGARVNIDREAMVIGRAGDVSYPNDHFLSPRHAVLIYDEGKLCVEDLHSLNGTYIKLRAPMALSLGDTFLMGRQVLRIQRFENELAVRSRAADGTRYRGSPSPMGRLKVEQIGVGGVIQDAYCLGPEGAIIGREKGDVIFPRDRFMSSRHARIWVGEDNEYRLEDMNSSNGTWLKIWERRALANGDFLFVGQQLFRLELP